MDDKTKMPIVSDGLDAYDEDDARLSLIKGTKLKFTNEGAWETGDSEVISPEQPFYAIEIIKAVQYWLPEGRPDNTKTIILAPDEKWPDIDQLNAEAPDEDWVEKFGRKVGPYQRTYVVYLITPDNMRIYTFPTSTDGGGRAVRELREATRLARRVKGLQVFPKLRLTDEFMNTQYGGRQRPSFAIIGFETLGAETALVAAEAKQIEHQTTKPVEAKSVEAKPIDTKVKATAPAKSKPASGKPHKQDPDFDDPLD
jgi:hypothetical protein